MKKWTIEDSKELYNINGWGTSYFGVNESGNIFVNPSKNNVKISFARCHATSATTFSRYS